MKGEKQTNKQTKWYSIHMRFQDFLFILKYYVLARGVLQNLRGDKYIQASFYDEFIHESTINVSPTLTILSSSDQPLLHQVTNYSNSIAKLKKRITH